MLVPGAMPDRIVRDVKMAIMETLFKLGTIANPVIAMEMQIYMQQIGVTIVPENV